MIEGLKLYSEYKKSGLTWLYRIPVGWNEQRSKYLSREVDRRSTSGDEMRLSMSQRHGLIPSADFEVEMSIQNWLFRTFGTTGFEHV